MTPQDPKDREHKYIPPPEDQIEIVPPTSEAEYREKLRNYAVAGNYAELVRIASDFSTLVPYLLGAGRSPKECSLVASVGHYAADLVLKAADRGVKEAENQAIFAMACQHILEKLLCVIGDAAKHR